MPRRTERDAIELVRRGGEWSPARVERGLSSVHRGLRRRRTLRISSVAVVLLALVGVGLVRRDSAVAPAGPVTSTLRLEDGSVIVSNAETRFAVREVSATRVIVGLESGLVDVEVTPRPEREFIVEAGALKVVVVGTRFEVDRRRDETRVRVVRGHVRVLDRERPTVDLLAGDERSFALEPPQPTLEVAPTPKPASVGPAAPPPVPAPAPKKVAPAPKNTATAGMETGEWRPLAQRGVYDRAYELLDKQEVPENVDDLLLASDAARLSGHPRAALTYLERVVKKHPDDERAPMAAFTQGRILSELSRFSEAARAFDQAVELGAQGSLHENALARAVEAHHKAGNAALAKARARAYLERYPHGRWENLVRASGAVDE